MLITTHAFNVAEVDRSALPSTYFNGRSAEFEQFAGVYTYGNSPLLLFFSLFSFLFHILMSFLRLLSVFCRW